MPRFHLNLFNNLNVEDEEGTEYLDLEHAKAAAVRAAREIMAAHIVAGTAIALDDRIEIADGQGWRLSVVTFGEVISIVERRGM
jgi:hypothetical protein